MRSARPRKVPVQENLILEMNKYMGRGVTICLRA